MKKYTVLRDCHGFQGRYWSKGTVIELADDVTPPKHFKLVSEGSVAKPVAQDLGDILPLSEVGKKPVITTGMSTGLQPPDSVHSLKRHKKHKT